MLLVFAFFPHHPDKNATSQLWMLGCYCGILKKGAEPKVKMPAVIMAYCFLFDTE